MKNNRILKYREAISEALVQGMDQDPSVLIMGCGVDDDVEYLAPREKHFKNLVASE